MADLQNTVRQLKIILFSLFCLLIIRASIWRPYDKNLAKPCYCQTPLTLRFHLVFWCLSSNRHFATLTLKFLLNRITKETITNLQNTCQTPRNHRFQEVFCCWSSERHFGALTVKFASNPIVAQNIANLQNTVTDLLFTVFRWSTCAYHVSNTLESLLWNF